MGRARSELAAELRSFATNTPYVIYYELAPNGIVIVRMLHHARDLDAIFLNEGDLTQCCSLTRVRPGPVEG